MGISWYCFSLVDGKYGNQTTLLLLPPLSYVSLANTKVVVVRLLKSFDAQPRLAVVTKTIYSAWKELSWHLSQ